MTRTDAASSESHIPALDGIRALSVLGIVWYHVWQQSWLSPSLAVRIPFLKATLSVSLDFLPRTGYLFVDMMLLLSAFCLFLPYARAMCGNLSMPSTAVFYRKRVARIIPSYYLSVLVLFIAAVLLGKYDSSRQAVKELLSTLTFTQTFFPDVLLNSHINGVLWTAAIEVQFYLIFPLLARAFRKSPIITYLSMVAAGFLYLYGFALRNPDTLRITLNQLAGFLGVFANGMLSAYLYVRIRNSTREKSSVLLCLASVLVFILSVYVLSLLQKRAAVAQPVQDFQARYRFPLSVVFSLILLSVSLGGPLFRVVLGNPLMHFLALISYNLYIWHQWIAVHLKEVRFPFWAGEELPNIAGNTVWQQKYTWTVLAVSVAIAALITYLYERPLHDLLLKSKRTKERN